MFLYAVVGAPVSHSLSPLIHNTLIKKYGLKDCNYTLVHIEGNEPEKLPLLWEDSRLRGINVTMPHKKNIMKFLDNISAEASLYKSVNTVKKDLNGLTGYNTDVPGFLKTLYENEFSPVGKKVVILGAGDVACSLSVALACGGVSSISVAARNKKSLQDLTGYTHSVTGFLLESCGFSQEELEKMCADASLIVNTTPLGMHSVDGDFENTGFLKSLSKDCLVYDLIYNPQYTTFLKSARELGLNTVNGLSMLIWQAFYAFDIFFGIMPTQQDKIMIENIIYEKQKVI